MLRVAVIWCLTNYKNIIYYVGKVFRRISIEKLFRSQATHSSLGKVFFDRGKNGDMKIQALNESPIEKSYFKIEKKKEKTLNFITVYVIISVARQPKLDSLLCV